MLGREIICSFQLVLSYSAMCIISYSLQIKKLYFWNSKLFEVPHGLIVNCFPRTSGHWTNPWLTRCISSSLDPALSFSFLPIPQEMNSNHCLSCQRLWPLNFLRPMELDLAWQLPHYVNHTSIDRHFPPQCCVTVAQDLTPVHRDSLKFLFLSRDLSH